MNSRTRTTAPVWRQLILFQALLSLLLPTVAFARTDVSGIDSALTREIVSALDFPGLQTGFQGILIQSLRDQSVLYARNADQVFLPASNNKLLTSVAALALLGRGYVYHTRIYRTGSLAPDGTLNGDLYLRGSGDPLLMPADLDSLASQVHQAGIQRVTGHLRIDDTLFDRQLLGDTWAWDDEAYYYSAQVSALNVNENLIDLRAVPGRRIGAPIRVEMSPTAHYAKLSNHAVTGAPKSKPALVFSRVRGQNLFVVSGSLPIDTSDQDAPTDRLTVENPARFTAFLLQEALGRAGVKVEHDDIAEGSATPQAAEPVAEHESIPLSELLKKLNKPSDNLVAECLLKTIGAAKTGIGTSGADGTGARAAKEFFLRIGLDTDRIQQADGSGLSRTNFVSPRNMVRLLAYVAATPDFNTLYDSLPIAGIDGSLSGRMKSTPAANNCRAKTGYVSNVSSLSGYVTTRDGEMLVFSILMNNHLAPNRVCTAAQDRIVNLLANFSRISTAVAGTPR